jgi:hypothetical protein
MERLMRTPDVRPISSAQDIADVVQHAMEALQPEPEYPADDRQLVFNELATILDFLDSDFSE